MNNKVEFKIKVCEGSDVKWEHGIEPDTYTSRITLDLTDLRGVQDDPLHSDVCWLWFGGFGPEGEPYFFEVNEPYEDVIAKWSKGIQ